MDNTFLIFFLIALIVFLIGIILSFIIHKKNRPDAIFTPFNILLAGTFISLIAIFIPIYINEFKNGTFSIVKVIVLSVHNAIRVLTVDDDYSMVNSAISIEAGWIGFAYTIFAALLFIILPILTFGLVLSFFQNISSSKSFLLGFRKEAFIFSELNEKSIILAKSEYEKYSKKGINIIIVFTDVYEDNKEVSSELIAQAKSIRAICFKKDLLTIKYNFHSKKTGLNFFIIGSDETENIRQTLFIKEKLSLREKTRLFFFSSSTSSELLLSNYYGKVVLRRIDESRSLIYRILYSEGYNLFSNAISNGQNKSISILIVGFGKYGCEMLKALVWLTQMEGYDVRINVFDVDKESENKFAFQCPELMENKEEYNITFHSGINVNSIGFVEAVRGIGPVTFAFVALGNDDQNIESAINLRIQFIRNNTNSIIQAIVFSPEKQESLKNICNSRGEKYDISFIGDLNTSYSDDVIINSPLEKEALSRHLLWGEEESFWKYEYNYRSSMASVIHDRLRRQCNIPGSEKKMSERTAEEIDLLRRLEHRRWIAYMRSEGFIYSGSIDSKSRNDLAKMHNLLTPFDDLPIKEQQKDDF